jgi:hypothetical protein
MFHKRKGEANVATETVRLVTVRVYRNSAGERFHGFNTV